MATMKPVASRLCRSKWMMDGNDCDGLLQKTIVEIESLRKFECVFKGEKIRMGKS